MFYFCKKIIVNIKTTLYIRRTILNVKHEYNKKKRKHTNLIVEKNK